MGDYPLGPKERASKILQDLCLLGIKSAHLRDEIFLQLIKQTTSAPSASGYKSGFLLLAMCAGCFPPSTKLAPVVREHVMCASKDAVYTDVTMKRLQAVVDKGARSLAPSKREVALVKVRCCL